MTSGPQRRVVRIEPDVSEEHIASLYSKRSAEADEKARQLTFPPTHLILLPGLLLDPEDGSDMFLRNVVRSPGTTRQLQTEYRTLQ
jgi:hypothetical protein